MATATTTTRKASVGTSGGSKLKAPSKGFGKELGSGSATAKKSTKSSKSASRMGITPMAATDNNQLQQRSTNNFTLDDVNAHDYNDVDDGGGGERGSGKTMTDSSSLSSAQQNLTIDSLGSLVCVRDGHIGILRYFGETHFEKGLWCGVELAEPLGKNDGSVMGYRYFTCENKYGIFAPLSIVRKVTSKPLATAAATALLQTSEINAGISSGAAGNTNTKLPVDIKNRPAALPMPIQQLQCSNNELPMYYQKESARHTVAPPVAPATTPVTEEIKYITSAAAAVASSAPLLRNARAKNESKRGKDSHHRVNPQQKKKRKLDSSQKQVWNDDDDDDSEAASSTGSTSSGNNINVTTKSNPTSQIGTPESASSRMPQSIDLPNFMNARLKEEVLLGAGFLSSPLFSPTQSYKDGFATRLASSTPSNHHGYRAAMSRLERLKLDKSSPSQGTPKSSRLGENFEPKRSAPQNFIEESSTSRNPNFRVGYSDKEWVQSAPRHHSVTTSHQFDLERNPLPEENIFDTLPTPLSNLGHGHDESFFEKSLGELEEESTDGALASPLGSTTKEDTTSDDINFESFPAKRPSSISLAFQGFSSEESSEQGIFGVSTPELIGGDSASLALSIPTSCCSSPDALIENDNDNESSLGLLTPSHLQDCWNSNTNDEDIYQHLRSPSVDDMEEFEEEDKTVDQDLSDVSGLTTAPPLNPFRGRMASSVHGTLVLNENDGLTTIPHNLYQPMHHSLHEGILHIGQGRVRRDRTYTQLPVVPNLNQQLSESQQPNQPQPIESQHQQQTNQHGNHHPPLSFRGSGSGSGYCASDPFTDSDFNTESEADHDHDECSSSAATNPPTSTSGGGTHVNSATSLKNRNARVIDGALYTSHHHHQNGSSSGADRVSPNLQQHHSQQPMSMSHHTYMHPSNRPENSYSTTSSVTDSAVSVGKSMDMISSSISVSVSSNSASACASEMESSGFYSDASERNPSGGSVMSESDHVYGGQHHHNHGHRRSSRHLSKSSSDCDDSSVALSMGMKMVPLKPLTQSEDDDSVQILDASSMCNDEDDDEVEECIDEMSSLEMTGSLNETMLAATCNEGKDGRVKQITPTKSSTTSEHIPSQKSMSNGKANPNVGEYQSQSQSNKDQQVPNIDEYMQYDDEEMDVDLFAEYENTGKESKEDMDKGVGLNALNLASASSVNLGASQLATHSVVAMDLALSKSPSSISPLCSPMNGLHGNLFETGGAIPSGFLSGGGNGNCGGVACYRSQSVNCIASLTSSTSSASTVTTKSCVTAGAASGGSGGTHIPATTKSTRGGKKGGNGGGGSSTSSSTSSSKSKVQSIESKSSKHGSVSAAVTGNHAKKAGSAGRSTVENVTSSNTESSGRIGGGTSTNINNNNDTVTAGSSGSVRGNVPPAAEQSSVVSTTTGGSSNSANATSNRRSSRMNATGGKSSASAGGPRKNASSTGGGGATSRANTSSVSTISSSSELNKSNRSIAAKGSLHGSNRSLASVGLGPASNNSSKLSNSSPQSKKLNKWDAVMSKIAENQHKQINVKDVKSKVFNSSVLKGGGAESASGPGSAGSNSSAGGEKATKTSKSGKTASRVTLVDRSNENDPLVPSAVHRRQHHFSSRSSTVSDSSLDDHQPHRGPPPAKHHRVKKDASINRRQVSDLSSASDYSAKAQSQTNSASSNKNNSSNNPKSMTTGGTRRVQRGGVTANNTNTTTTSSATAPHGTKSTNSTSNTGGGGNASGTKSQGTKGSSQTTEIAKKKGGSSNLTSTTRGGTSKAKVGSFSVSSHQNDNPSTKSHPAVKPLRDRNRLGPVGKNYGSSALDANANESEGPLLRGQANGELDPSAKSCTKVPGSAEPLIADPSNNHVISKNKSAVSHNNRVSSHNQHNTQNSVLVQENSSLKEEVSRLTSIVSDLQEQISRLATSGEETKKTLEGCLKDADQKCVALGIVAQQLDKQRLGEYEQLVQQQAENKEWKHQLDEKLAELQKLQSEYEKEREQNQEEMRALTKRHELEVDITVKNCEDKLEQIEQRHNLTLLELKRSHAAELERLQEDHRQQLEELQKQQLQAIEEFQDEHPEPRMLKEIDSLRAIVDMKLERIKFLEKQVVDHEQLLKDFQASKDSEARLIAKIEDINAQLEKARKDRRETIAKCLKLEEELKHTQLDNERLLRSKEELEWKLKPFENEQNKNK